MFRLLRALQGEAIHSLQKIDDLSESTLDDHRDDLLYDDKLRA
jgi:hypothetical protein